MTDVLQLAKNYIDLVKESGIPIDQAYLFGSYAKGKVWEGSDIDICIISDRLGRNYSTEKYLLNKLALKIDPRIEPVAYTRSDFQNKYDSLVDEVKRFGILISN